MRRLLFPHLAVWLIGGALIRIAVVPAEVCPAVTSAQLNQTITNAVDWLVRGQSDDGRYTYGYLRDVDVVPDEYVLVRHAGALFTLYQAAGGDIGGPEVFAAAESGLGFALENLVETDEGTAFVEPRRRASLGANGLFLVALAQRRLVTGDQQYDDLMKRVASFLAAQRDPNGGLWAFWDPVTREPVGDLHGIFATGEAFWGLALANTAFPGQGWDIEALRTAHYLANDRDRLEGEVTRYPDHWAALGMSELGPELLDEELIEYARALAGFFSVRIRVESQRRGSGINLLVRGYPGPPSGVGTAGEGMASLRVLADVDLRMGDMADGMDDDLTCMAGIMFASQVSAEQAQQYVRPELARGAWFYRDYSQIDDQQHNVAALLVVRDYLKGAE